MSWPELGDSLFELVSGIVEPVAEGMVVTEADLSVPLEVQLGRRGDRLVLFAQPPYTRWRSGFVPATHMSRLSIGLRSEDGR